MPDITSSLIQLGAICTLSALSEIMLSGTKFSSALQLIAGLLIVGAVLRLVSAVTGWL